MDKKKIIAAIAAISLTTGVAGFATACGEDETPQHKHTYSTEWTPGENTHWHESTCEHKGLKQPDSEAPHVDEDGSKRCDVCDYDMREVIAITVAQVKGGKVTLDNASPKEGDTVTATVTADEGYVVKGVKLGTESQTLDANNKFTFTATSAVTVTAEFEGKTIVLDTATVETAKGNVAFKFPEGKTEYKVGDDVVLQVTTDDYYKLTALYVNGNTKVNYADDISQEGLILLPEFSNETLTVTAEFLVGYRDITVTFKGKRMGETDIQLESDCGLTVSGYSEVTLQDSKTTLIKAEIGKKYAVSIPNSGWQSGSFTVGESNTYDVELQWTPKLRYSVHSANADLSHFNDGYITSTNDNCDLGLYTEAFVGDNAMLTVNISAKDVSPTNNWPRQFVGFMFERNSQWYAKHIAVHTIADSNKRIEWDGNDNIWDSKSIIKDLWGIDGNYCNPFTGDMLKKFLGDEGLDITMIRHNGNEFLVYVDGTYVGQKTLDASYKGQLASPMIVLPRMTKGNRVDYSLTQDVAAINAYLKSTVKLSENNDLSEGVSVTVQKAGDAFKEDVTLTITIPANSVLTEFVVDGEDLIGGVVAGTAANTYKYTFSSWRVAGEHEFQIKATALGENESVDQTVKMDVADGTKVRFIRDGETTIERTFADGAVSFNAKVGAWKVQVFGFNTWLNVGVVSVSGVEKTFDLNGIFSVGASSASGYVFDMAKGTLKFNGKTRPDMRLNVDHSAGQDLWVATKAQFPQAALDYLKTNGGAGFTYGVGMKNAAGTNVALNIYNEDAKHHRIQTQASWDGAEDFSDFLYGQEGNLQNGKYADALVGSGLYFIERYNASTGQLELYLGESLDTIVLFKAFTYSWTSLGANALITAAGISGGSKWSQGYDADFTCTLGIGSTLEEALGVAGKTVAVNVTGDKSADGATTYCTVNVSEFTAGNTANIEITPTADYSVKTVKINGRAVSFDWNEQEQKLLYAIDRYCLTTLDIEIIAEKIVRVDVNAQITAKQQAIISSINGRAFTLTDGLSGIYTGNITADGKLQISDVIVGQYTLKIAGYFDKQVEVTQNGMADVTVEYIFLTDNGKADLTNMNDPTKKITWKDTSGNIECNTVDRFTDVYAKAHFDPFELNGDKDNRISLHLKYENGKSARIDFDIAAKYASCALQSTDWDTYFDSWNTKKEWKSGDALLESIKTNGVDITLIRNGSHVFIYVNDVLGFDYELTVKGGFDYASKPAGLNIQYCQDIERDTKHGFTLDVREAFPVEITKKIAEGAPESATIELNKTSYKVGDTVEVTVTPAEGYVCTVSINGTDVTDKLVDNKYTFVASEFGPYEIAVKTASMTVVHDSLEVNVLNSAAVNANGIEFTLTNGEDVYKAVVTNNKLAFTKY